MPTPAERIAEIHGDLDLDENVTFHYSWNSGYEKLEVRYIETDSGFSYVGSFHPNGHCIGNPCHICGKTWMD